ncbi:MAG: twin-arginine translocase TatA/TatE family subunit [Deltaproteobacteria bacterium]
MFGIGMPELAVIIVVALVVLGPKRLPEVARSLGKGLAEFRRLTGDVNKELDAARHMIESEAREHERGRRDTERATRKATTATATPDPQATTPEPESTTPDPEPTAPDPALVAAPSGPSGKNGSDA